MPRSRFHAGADERDPWQDRRVPPTSAPQRQLSHWCTVALIGHLGRLDAEVPPDHFQQPLAAATPSTSSTSSRREIAAGMRFVIGHPIMRMLIVCSGISNFFSSMLSALGLIFLVRVLHASPGYLGIILSLSAVGGIVAGFVAKQLSKKIGSARIIWLSQLGFQAPMFLIPLARPGWGALLYAAGLFSFGFGAVVYNISQVSYRQAITPPEMLGRMNASVRFLVWGTIPLGAALGGVLGSLIGVRPTIWVSVAGCWSSGLWLIFSPLRRLRNVDDFVPTAGHELSVSVQASDSGRRRRA